MPTQTWKPSKRTLKRTAKILQIAHDNIETNGFDINSYIGSGQCYIGSIRCAAGVNSEPPGGIEKEIAGTDSGGGPELTLALSVLDNVAEGERGAKRAMKMIQESFPYPGPGRLVERLGLNINDRQNPPSDKKQTEYALKLLRKAITEVQKELDVC